MTAYFPQIKILLHPFRILIDNRATLGWIGNEQIPIDKSH